MGTPIDLVALLAETEAEEKAAKAVELTEEEKAAHLLLERRSKAREERATAEKARREVDGGTREAIARKAAALRGFFGFLEEEGFRPDNPSAALPRPGAIFIATDTGPLSALKLRCRICSAGARVRSGVSFLSEGLKLIV